MNITLCSCGSGEIAYTLKLISSGRPAPYPLWVPQIKQTCGDCGAYQGFAKQTPELIALVNEKQQKIVL